MDKTVEKGAQIFTDEYPIYDTLPYMGYNHDKVLHSHQICVMGKVHTNAIEGFWSLSKNGIRDVFHSVSPKYLQVFISFLRKLALQGAQFS